MPKSSICPLPLRVVPSNVQHRRFIVYPNVIPIVSRLICSLSSPRLFWIHAAPPMPQIGCAGTCLFPDVNPSVSVWVISSPQRPQMDFPSLLSSLAARKARQLLEFRAATFRQNTDKHNHLNTEGAALPSPTVVPRLTCYPPAPRHAPCPKAEMW